MTFSVVPSKKRKKKVKKSRTIKPGWSSSSRLRPSPEIKYRPMNTISEYGSIYGEPTPISGVANQISFRRVWSGVRTPNFGRTKKRNLPVNSHYVYRYDTADGGCTQYGWRKPGPGSDKSHTFAIAPLEGQFGIAVTIPVHDNSVRDRAIAKLAERAGQEVNNLAQDLVQINQLTRAVGDTCKRITGAIRAVRQRDFLQAISRLWSKDPPRFRRGKEPPITWGKSTSENWLELQYGWKPLLQDVEGAAKSLAYLNAATFMVQSTRSSSSKTTTSGGPIFVTGETMPSGYKTVISRTTSKFGMMYRMGEPLDVFLKQIGFDNPISLAWEILPYSFVLDWFLPIGDFLDGLNRWKGLSFVSGWEVQFTRKTTLADVYYYLEDSTRVQCRYGNWSSDAVLLDRSALSDFPQVQWPSWKNPVSATHAANALALMRVAFGNPRGGSFYGK